MINEDKPITPTSYMARRGVSRFRRIDVVGKEIKFERVILHILNFLS